MPDRSPHILNASSNLLGFCFFVLVSIKTLGVVDINLVDKIVALSILLFTVSCVFSFISMRTSSLRDDAYETFADYTFFAGLVSLMAIAVLLSLNKL